MNSCKTVNPNEYALVSVSAHWPAPDAISGIEGAIVVENILMAIKKK